MIADVLEFLSSGGPVLIVILAVAVLLCSLIAERYWFFQRESKTLCSEMAKGWHQRADHQSWSALKIRQAMIDKVRQSLMAHLSTLRLLVVLCPLLGLLGTVTGMIHVFDVMAVTGTGNARAMAAGISQATIPTMAGMVVSIIGLYFKARFEGLAKKQLDLFTDRLVK